MTGIGFRTFRYTKQQVSSIIELLRCNHRDPVKVFDVVWEDDFLEYPRESAPDVLSLITEVNTHMVSMGDTAKMVLDAMSETHKGECCYWSRL